MFTKSINTVSKLLSKGGDWVLKRLGLSKTDGVFIAYTWWAVLPVFAMPPGHPPEMDPILRDLQVRFVSEAGLIPLSLERLNEQERVRREKEQAYVVIGERLTGHGMSQKAGDRYKAAEEERVVGTVVVRKPSEVYLEHKGLYHGYRLFFGNGYIVPSLLFKRTNTSTSASDFFEILPATGALKELKDLRKHAHEVGVHVLGQFLFPVQGEGGAHYDPKTFSKRLGLGDRIEAGETLQDEETFPIGPIGLKDLKKDKLSKSLKTQIQGKKVNRLITQ